MKLAGLILALNAALLAQPAGNVIVVTAGGGDYLWGAGGTLAKLIEAGHAVYVVQFANDEKNALGLPPAETRLANNAEADQGARLLGVKEIVRLDHKSGELSQVSSNEMRNQIFALIRLYKPRIIFHPDPWIHYDADWDRYFTARAAEESSYGSSSYFAPELTRMGFPGFGVAETYYYAARRPYRPGEGGHQGAAFRPVDITSTFERKSAALLALRTTNQLYATQVKQRLEAAGKPSALLSRIDTESTGALVRAYAEELAGTIGAKHGFRYGEEFNYHGRGEPVPAYIRERARPLP